MEKRGWVFDWYAYILTTVLTSLSIDERNAGMTTEFFVPYLQLFARMFLLPRTAVSSQEGSQVPSALRFQGEAQQPSISGTAGPLTL